MMQNQNEHETGVRPRFALKELKNGRQFFPLSLDLVGLANILVVAVSCPPTISSISATVFTWDCHVRHVTVPSLNNSLPAACCYWQADKRERHISNSSHLLDNHRDDDVEKTRQTAGHVSGQSQRSLCYVVVQHAINLVTLLSGWVGTRRLLNWQLTTDLLFRSQIVEKNTSCSNANHSTCSINNSSVFHSRR